MREELNRTNLQEKTPPDASWICEKKRKICQDKGVENAPTSGVLGEE